MKVYKQNLLTGETEVIIHGESKNSAHKLFKDELAVQKFVDQFAVREYTAIVIKQLNLIPLDKLSSDDFEQRHHIQFKLVADSTEAYKAEVISSAAVALLSKYFPAWPRLEEVKEWSTDFYTRNKDKAVEYGVMDRISFQEEREAIGFNFNLSK